MFSVSGKSASLLGVVWSAVMGVCWRMYEGLVGRCDCCCSCCGEADGGSPDDRALVSKSACGRVAADSVPPRDPSKCAGGRFDRYLAPSSLGWLRRGMRGGGVFQCKVIPCRGSDHTCSSYICLAEKVFGELGGGGGGLFTFRSQLERGILLKHLVALLLYQPNNPGRLLTASATEYMVSGFRPEPAAVIESVLVAVSGEDWNGA